MKFISRLLIMGFALSEALGRPLKKRKAKGILLAHNFLLGDTLMLTPLMKRSLSEFDKDPKFLLCRPAFKELLTKNGFGYSPVVYDLASPRTTLKLLITIRGRVSTALILGDTRYSWLALACGAKDIAAERLKSKLWKSVPITRWVDFMPRSNVTWSDQVAQSFFPNVTAYSDPDDWPTLNSQRFDLKVGLQPKHVFVHLGASSRLRYWSSDNWRMLVSKLIARGYAATVSVGPGEDDLLEPLECLQKAVKIRGDKSLSEIATVMASSDLIICVDTGIAHLAKLISTPSIVIYGPGDPRLHGPGDYWCQTIQYALRAENVSCRDQSIVFGREISWVRRCSRSVKECLTPGYCMNENSELAVFNLAQKVLDK